MFGITLPSQIYIHIYNVYTCAHIHTHILICIYTYIQIATYLSAVCFKSKLIITMSQVTLLYLRNAHFKHAVIFIGNQSLFVCSRHFRKLQENKRQRGVQQSVGNSGDCYREARIHFCNLEILFHLNLIPW